MLLVYEILWYSLFQNSSCHKKRIKEERIDTSEDESPTDDDVEAAGISELDDAWYILRWSLLKERNPGKLQIMTFVFHTKSFLESG